MPGPFEAGQVRDEELAAPQGAVGAVPGAVEGHPDHRAFMAVVGQAGGDVRVMVLHAAGVHVEVESVLGGQVLRVQVVGDDLRVDAEQPAEVLDALGERAQRRRVLQVPDVVGYERAVGRRQAERVLQLGAAGQHGAREPLPYGDRFGDVTPGAPDKHLPAVLC